LIEEVGTPLDLRPAEPLLDQNSLLYFPLGLTTNPVPQEGALPELLDKADEVGNELLLVVDAPGPLGMRPYEVVVD